MDICIHTSIFDIGATGGLKEGPLSVLNDAQKMKLVSLAKHVKVHVQLKLDLLLELGVQLQPRNHCLATASFRCEKKKHAHRKSAQPLATLAALSAQLLRMAAGLLTLDQGLITQIELFYDSRILVSQKDAIFSSSAPQSQ